MADQTTDPHDDKVRSVPLPSNSADAVDGVVEQENQNPEVALGGGEWPSPDAPPTGPAPGTAEEGPNRERPAGQPIAGPPPGSASEPGLQQDGRSAGDRGPARAGDAGLSGGEEPGEFPPMKDALEADPVAAGSQAVAPAEEDDQAEGTTRYA